MSHNFSDTVSALTKLDASGVLPGQTYEHPKTGGVYLVIAVGLNEPDLEPLVHYRDATDEYATVWTRTMAAFTGKALDGDTLVQRFVRVG